VPADDLLLALTLPEKCRYGIGAFGRPTPTVSGRPAQGPIAQLVRAHG
jgi:hypothetical protein